MIFAILTMLTALTISAVAIYYSVAGLVAIFAAAALPIMVMGGALEIAKLVTAVWLHRYWKQATWWLKTYLSTAVFVLMVITSMGIFGFLSKAHIEQTSASQESVAKVEQLTSEIARQQAIITRAEEQIKKLETSGTGNDAQIQAQIDKEQERIDNAYARIQPAIDEQNRIIGSQAKLYQDELARVDEQLATLQKYIDAGDKESIKKAQAMIGARQDGSWGRNTAAAAEEWRKGRQQARADLLTKIEQATNNPQARAAANEIKRLRQSVETQIAESNKLINRLRQQIGKTDKAQDIDAEVDEQNLRIKTANAEIDKLTEEKYTLQAEYRKLEAEVGPIKYIAEFVYGEEANNNMLEEAVRWVIIIIIFVFDPLAVLLLIASQYTFEYHRKRDEDNHKERLRQDEWREYEQKRAQAIVDNPGFTPSSDGNSVSNDEVRNTTEDEINENTTAEDTGTIQETDQTLSTTQEEESAEGRNEDNQTDTSEQEKYRIAEEYSSVEIVQEEPVEKKDTESSEELKQVRTQELEDQENDASWQQAKRSWKEDHPNETLKEYKERYINGEIDQLPWEDRVESKKKNYIMKQGDKQVRKETVDNSDLTEVSDSTGYIQNSEQNGNTLWNRIRNG